MSASQKYKVLDLKPLKNHMYEITVASKSYKLAEETILKYRLVKGKEFADLDLILKDDLNNILYAKIRSYALRYPKSKKDLKLYLSNKYDLSSDILSDFISRLENEGIVNDNMYRESVVASLLAKGYGKQYIYNTLRAKGLDTNIEIEPNSDILDKLILKQLKNYHETDKNKLKLKLLNYLMRKGYSYSEVKDKIEKFI